MRNIETNLVKIANSIQELATLGYCLTSSQRNKLNTLTLLLHCYNNWSIFNDEQKKNLEVVYSNTI